MRKYILTITLSILTSALAFASDGGYSIKMKVKGLKDTVAYLANYYGNKQYIQDTALVNSNGEMVFDGKEKLPGGIYIFWCPAVKGPIRTFEFIVTDKQFFSLETDTVNFVKNMKIKGSDENKYWYEYLNFIQSEEDRAKPLSEALHRLKDNSDSTKICKDKLSVIDKEVVNFKKTFIEKHPETFVAKIFRSMEEVRPSDAEVKASKDSLFEYKYYKAHYFDNLDFSDDRMLRTPLFHKKIDFYVSKLTSPAPDSLMVAADYLIDKSKANKEVFKYMTWYFTYTYETSQVMGYDAIFVHLVERYYMTNQAYWLDSTKLAKITKKAMDTKPLLIGKKAPDQIMQDSLGNHITLYSIKADYLVVVFWDPDCGHCKKELPKVRDFYTKYKDRVSLKIFAVCTDLEKKSWKKLVQDEHYNWINVVDPYGQRRQYDIQSTPMIYLLDKDKKIVAKKLGAEQLGDFIEHEMKMAKEKKK